MLTDKKRNKKKTLLRRFSLINDDLSVNSH